MREWDVATGDEFRVLPGIGEGPVAAVRRRHRADHLPLRAQRRAAATVIDMGLTASSARSNVRRVTVAPDSLRVAGDLAVFHTVCNGELSATTYVVDAGAGSRF